MEKPIISTNFGIAQKVIEPYDNTRDTAESVYFMANALWRCYKTIQNESDRFTASEWKEAVNTLQFAAKVIGEKEVDFSLIPDYIVKNVRDTASATKTGSSDILESCAVLVDKDIFDKDDLSKYLQKAYLVIILAILKNLAGNDIFSLINKCIVFDHLGNQAYSQSEFCGLLKKATGKASVATFASKKKLDVYYSLGMLNYRLNNYNEAIKLLQKYAENLINQEFAVAAVSTKCGLVYILISIAYCFEKLNNSESINKAINILEAVKKNIPVDAFNSTKHMSRIYGKTSEKPDGQCYIDYNVCDRRTRMEIFHALAHFYNERAVFYSEAVDTAEDIRIAREYISIAKSMDDENSLHSCHGLMCFEDNDFGRATKIYEEALLITDVNCSDALRLELLFYYAQSISASAGINSANPYWLKFEDYCQKTNNEDALAQYRIIKTKALLSGSKLYEWKLAEFRKMLDEILAYRLSKYVPKSVAAERDRIILTLNTFYALRSIIDGKSSWTDGIEEAFYNLGKYLVYIRDKKCSYSNFELKQEWLLSINDHSTECEDNRNNEVEIRRFRQTADDEIFFIEYKGLRVVCFGDYRNLIGSIYNVSFRGKLKEEYENEVVEQFKSNKHVDVLILAPTEEFANNAPRQKVLREIMLSGVCAVALGSTAAKIAKVVNGRGQNLSPVYCAINKSEALQMAFCLGIYELMRKNLISPTPMLGLAPLVESKSYSFQAGERIPNLLLPPSFDATDRQLCDNLVSIIKKLDSIQLNIHKKNQFPKNSKEVLEKYQGLLENQSDISFIAFFDEQSTSNSQLHTISYVLLKESLKQCIEYICPGTPLEKYALVSMYKTVAGYEDADTTIAEARKPGCFCCSDDCPDKYCNSLCVGLQEKSPCAEQTKKLLQNIFSLIEVKKNVHCICTNLEYTNSKGILLIITDYLEASSKELRQICRAVHRSIGDYDDPIPVPPSHIQFATDHVIWETLLDLKKELEKAKESSSKASKIDGTANNVKDNAKRISSDIKVFISNVNTALSKGKSTPPIMEVVFLDSLKTLQEKQPWGDYMTTEINDHLDTILSHAKERYPK